MDEKHIKKYMRLAKQVGEDNNPCYSRQIGSVIVDSKIHKILGTGYNGPPRKTDHCDEPCYLETHVWGRMTKLDKERVFGERSDGMTDLQMRTEFVDTWKYKKTCPRKILGFASGTHLEFCTCAHSEANAIVNASESLYGALLFCWCPLPCQECTKLIINSGIAKVYYVSADQDYSFGSRLLFNQAKIELIEHPAEYYLED